MPLSRRTFLSAAGKSAAVTLASPLLPATAEQPNGHSDREPLQELAYSAVQLTGGPLAEHYDAVHAHYLSLSNDRLLKVYRQRADLHAPGEDMGGWYDLNGFVPGHSLGQYISGLARMAASTGDSATAQKVHDLVAGFAQTLGPQNVSILRPETNLWICYTLDKHFVGLIDATTLVGQNDGPALLNRVLEGSQHLMPAQGRDRIGKKNPPYDETYIMPENLFVAAEITGNPKFADYAQRYLLNRELFDPLEAGRDPFPGQHAYSHAMALSSAGRAYLQEGNPKYRVALANGFKLLTETQQYASGGWGPNETFITPGRGELFTSLSSTVDHFETPCGSFAATKLARYLLRTATPQSSIHGDNLERVLFNTILVSRPPDSDGDYFYYTTYSPGAEKVYYKSKWPCCSGTLVQTVADYPLNVFFSSADGVYVNLYTRSRAQLSHRGTKVRLQQETAYPDADTVSLTVSPANPATFTLYLRLPAWLSRPATVTVNGAAVGGAKSGGSFLPVRRLWRSGDRVELTVPQDFRTEPIDEQHPETVALMRGPVQYVAIEPAKNAPRSRRVLPSSLKRVGPSTFLENDEGRQVVFVPLYAIQNETYSAYFSRA